MATAGMPKMHEPFSASVATPAISRGPISPRAPALGARASGAAYRALVPTEENDCNAHTNRCGANAARSGVRARCPVEDPPLLGTVGIGKQPMSGLGCSPHGTAPESAQAVAWSKDTRAQRREDFPQDGTPVENRATKTCKQDQTSLLRQSNVTADSQIRSLARISSMIARQSAASGTPWPLNQSHNSGSGCSSNVENAAFFASAACAYRTSRYQPSS